MIANLSSPKHLNNNIALTYRRICKYILKENIFVIMVLFEFSDLKLIEVNIK